MNQYKIKFFRYKYSKLPASICYREFETEKELIEYCKCNVDECNYSKYTTQIISLTEFLRHTV